MKEWEGNFSYYQVLFFSLLIPFLFTTILNQWHYIILIWRNKN